MVGGQPGQMVLEIPISKITRTKWTVGVAQVIKRLPCKCEALPTINKRVLNHAIDQYFFAEDIASVCLTL
jgi:hypothetical protein